MCRKAGSSNTSANRVNHKDYVKEASAFANSRGGWIFIGLTEDPQMRKPTQSSGVASIEATRLLDAARDAIAHHVSPSPYLEKIVNGPIPALSISYDRSVLVVHVPQSYDTPPIQSSERIYRRRVDVADPVEVIDRSCEVVPWSSRAAIGLIFPHTAQERSSKLCTHLQRIQQRFGLERLMQQRITARLCFANAVG